MSTDATRSTGGEAVVQCIPPLVDQLRPVLSPRATMLESQLELRSYNKISAVFVTTAMRQPAPVGLPF